MSYCQSCADSERKLRELTAEVEALRRDAGLWRARVAGSSDASHQCTRCWLSYTPKADESEDCPACGYDGIGPLDAARQQEAGQTVKGGEG